eukprot:XP_001709864.1 Hypothetical protein GL50803_88072 [Giardia lamblia ATCC 50803]
MSKCAEEFESQKTGSGSIRHMAGAKGEGDIANNAVIHEGLCKQRNGFPNNIKYCYHASIVNGSTGVQERLNCHHSNILSRNFTAIPL